MSEYIITVDETKADFDGNVPISAKQEIVRCRECKFKDEPWNCAAPYYVEQDGFCAWAERRTNDN